MTVKTSKISINDADILLAKRESQFCDMKARQIAPAKLSQTIASFANADGGEIYVGISEDAKDGFNWDGFPDEEAANAHIQIIQELFPIGDITRCEFLDCDNQVGLVLLVEIMKTREIMNASSGKTYIRRGAQNLPVDTPEKLERLRLDKGIISHEDRTLNIDIDDVTNSVAIIEFVLGVVPSAEPEIWLKKQQLVVKDKPTVACSILFSDEPQIALPKAAVKIYRYKTTDEIGTRDTLAFDPISIEGNAYHQIYESISETKKLTEGIPVLGAKGMEKVSYPTEAIHEVITNAIIHRDYSIQDDVHVRVFDNRVEVQSPGNLPGHVTVENYLDERTARNPKIVRLLNKFDNPPNKDVGEGLNTAFEAMRKLKLKDPILLQKANSVWVLLKHETLGTPQDIIVKYLRDNDEINNSRARKICFIGSENKVKRVFQKMIKLNLIERIPDRPLNKTGYRKGTNFPIDDNS